MDLGSAENLVFIIVVFAVAAKPRHTATTSQKNI